MSKLKKKIFQNAATLRTGCQRMQDIYDIIYSHDDAVMAEFPTMTTTVCYTYRQVKEQIEALALRIRLEMDCTDRFIGLYAENSLEWIVTFWAILRSGNKPFLINLRLPRENVESSLKRLDACCVIAGKPTKDFAIPTVQYTDLAARAVKEGAKPEAEFADSFALSTSGTTLQEKICIYDGKAVSQQIINLETIVRTNPKIIGTSQGQMKMLMFLPLYHVFGLEASYLWFTFLGATFVFLQDMKPETILRTVRNHGVTHVFAVPLLWHAIEKGVLRKLQTKDEKTQKKFHKAVARSLKMQNFSPRLGMMLAKRMFRELRGELLGNDIQFLITGGSFIKPSTLKLLNSIGYPLCNGYGMTEVGICSVELSKKPARRILGSIGKPFRSVEYRLGEQGQLLIRGSSLCNRILIDGEERAAQQWFDTGDIMHVDGSGRYYIDGRVSDIVFGENGENLNPDHAQQAYTLPHALNYAVVGDEENAKLMLIVQIARNLLKEQKQQLQEEIRRCTESLPPAYRVREVKYTFDPLMAEQGIKVSRAHLRRAIAAGSVRLMDLTETDRPAQGEESELKKVLRELYAKVLNLEPAQIADDKHFMNELGGTSLDYFTLIGEINERFGVALDFESAQFGYTLNDFERILKDLI